jgi:hypothetical protein
MVKREDGKRVRVLKDIDDQWRRDTRELMRKHGISVGELARRIGASKGSVSEALNPAKAKTQWSWVDACTEALRRAAAEPAAPATPVAAVRRSARSPAARAALATLTRDAKMNMLVAVLNTYTDDDLDEYAARVLFPRKA